MGHHENHVPPKKIIESHVRDAFSFLSQTIHAPGSLLLDMISQHQLLRIRLQVKLTLQVLDLIFLGIVPHQRYRRDQGNELVAKIAD